MSRNLTNKYNRRNKTTYHNRWQSVSPDTIHVTAKDDSKDEYVAIQ